jgi:hypothetical protein
MTELQQPFPAEQSDPDDVEQRACPKCDAQPGSPYRSRGGAGRLRLTHRRFTMVPRLMKALRVPTRRTAVRADHGGGTPPPGDGDGATPPDPDDALRRFTEAVTASGLRERDGGWLSGLRESIPDPGPVPSSRFL